MMSQTTNWIAAWQRRAIASFIGCSVSWAIAPPALTLAASSPSLVAQTTIATATPAQASSTQVPSNPATVAQPNIAQPNIAQANGRQALPLSVVLSLSTRQVSVYRGEMLIARYEVAVGREGWNTPTGEFSVFQKQVDPAWEHPFTGTVVPPGPDNPLGSRWIGFWSDGINAIGFHGTPDESVIGSAVSHGCVRMRNEDVLALYEQVSLDTPVTVLP
ncbi:MAG: L,D-transpeptidase family protein [Cyanobacteria bacterium P01_D01_bin.105]